MNQRTKRRDGGRAARVGAAHAGAGAAHVALAIAAIGAAALAGCREDPERAEARELEAAPRCSGERPEPGCPEPSVESAAREESVASPKGEALPRQSEALPPSEPPAEDDARRAPEDRDLGAQAHRREAVTDMELARVPGRGVRVERIDAANPASALLRDGDLVIGVDGQPVRDPKHLGSYLASVGRGVPVLLEIVRDGEARLVGVQLSSAPARPRPAPAAESAPAAPSTIVIVPAPAPAPVVIAGGQPGGGAAGGGGVVETGPALQPPVFSGPGIPQHPGATFAPPPGTPAGAYPQLPGVPQPPMFGRPLQNPF